MDTNIFQTEVLKRLDEIIIMREQIQEVKKDLKEDIRQVQQRVDAILVIVSKKVKAKNNG
jgi:hypothetical protein